MPHLIMPLLAAAAASVLSTAAADILHVPGDFPTIQEAIDAAVDGDEVEVHPGTYNEAIDFLGKAIRVYSTDGPDVTIIDAQQTGTVVTCSSGEGPDSMLEGFTITGGDASSGGGMHNFSSSPTITNCTFSDNYVLGSGGGMYNKLGSNPLVNNCTFSGNSADSGVGGGIFNFCSSPTVTNCTFSGNTANWGGGIFNYYSSSTVTNCTFSGNSAATGGGMVNGGGTPTVIDCTFSGNSAVGGGGGGMYNDGSSPTVTDCTFSGNSAFYGGGMSNREATSMTVTNCTFSRNTAQSGGGMVNIGSIMPMITNCTFTGNSAAGVGGGILNSGGSPTVTNCTFSANTAPGGGSGMYSTIGCCGNGAPIVHNCILWDNDGDEIVDVNGAATTASYSNVQGGWPGIGNIDADPLFVDPDNDDFHLSSGSPCIDAGNNWGVPIDENDYDEDGVLCELFPVDLDGNPRFNADEADFDPGCGVPVVVDMGAYEYQFDPADQVTFADLNGDGAVGVKDLLGLLGSWGPCAKGCCLADLDIDGAVGVTDLLIILGNWGPCP